MWKSRGARCGSYNFSMCRKFDGWGEWRGEGGVQQPLGLAARHFQPPPLEGEGRPAASSIPLVTRGRPQCSDSPNRSDPGWVRAQVAPLPTLRDCSASFAAGTGCQSNPLNLGTRGKAAAEIRLLRGELQS